MVKKTKKTWVGILETKNLRFFYRWSELQSNAKWIVKKQIHVTFITRMTSPRKKLLTCVLSRKVVPVNSQKARLDEL